MVRPPCYHQSSTRMYKYDFIQTFFLWGKCIPILANPKSKAFIIGLI